MPAAVTGLENRGSVRFHNLQSFWHDDGFTAGPLGFGAGVGGQGFASSLRLEVRGQGAKGLMAGTWGHSCRARATMWREPAGLINGARGNPTGRDPLQPGVRTGFNRHGLNQEEDSCLFELFTFHTNKMWLF